MATTPKTKKGLQFTRLFTKENVSPFDQFDYDYRDSVIKNPNGEKVFEMTNVEVPKPSSTQLTIAFLSKYCPLTKKLKLSMLFAGKPLGATAQDLLKVAVLSFM